MIFDKNLKLFMAGAELRGKFEELKKAGQNYALFSVYYYIKKKALKKEDFDISHWVSPNELEKSFRRVIQDSGIFTLVYGKEKQKFDKNKIDDWADALIEFSLRYTGKKTSIVDIDCQDICGVEKAWQLRMRLRNELPGRSIINVWHFADGKKGLERMIEYSDYIALGVPEFRRKNQYKNLLKVATFIKNKKPEIDIHLLGFSVRHCDMFKFCTSADSTSWIYPSSFGIMYGVRTNQCSKEKVISEMKNLGYDENWAKTKKKEGLLDIYFLEVTKKIITETCGPQD